MLPYRESTDVFVVDSSCDNPNRNETESLSWKQEGLVVGYFEKKT